MKELASGVLNWQRSERVTDRYGTVALYLDGESFPFSTPVGEKGRLYARIEEKRKSNHIGDAFRSLSPDNSVQSGVILLLGEGECFVDEWSDHHGDYFGVGVKPDDGRETDWLNPENLYKIHNSIVTLLWETV